MDLTSKAHRLYRRAVWVTAMLPLAGLAVVVDPAYRTWRLGAWAACLVAILALMAIVRRRPDRTVSIAATQAGLALAAAAVLPTSTEGAWLVAVAAQLASRLALAPAIAIAAVQTVVFGWLLSRVRPLEVAIDVPAAWFGFQLFAILLTHVARSEAEHRAGLAERNAQLLATRQLLAERTRAAERLKIARDLHDGLGHHLSALTLNLEAASHLAGGEAREHVHRAQAVARAMLSDVRQTVSGVRDEGLDPIPAIRRLVESIDRPAVHFDAPAILPIADPSRADTVMRLVQEIVTNAIRHAQARNLWISVSQSPAGIEIEGRDDGCGAHGWSDGHGLRGMRERLSLLGGSLDVRSAPGTGFFVQAHIPQTGGPE
jgi:signal transduction histidine kinase